MVIGAIVMVMLTTWKRGRGLVASRYAQQVMPLATFWTRMQYDHSARVEGTAVYMTSLSAGTPPAMLQMYLHGHVVHEQVILLTVITEESARVSRSQRVEVQEIEPGLIRVIAHYGFVEHPDIPKVLAQPNPGSTSRPHLLPRPRDRDRDSQPRMALCASSCSPTRAQRPIQRRRCSDCRPSAW